MSEFVANTLEVVAALWGTTSSEWPPTVILNPEQVKGTETMFNLHDVRPDAVPGRIAAIVRDQGATEVVFAAPWMAPGLFGGQSVMSAHMTPEAVETFTARLKPGPANLWRVGRWKHVANASAPIPEVQAALREAAGR